VNGLNRKRAQKWMAWLLPALLLRSFIPVGFMPMVGPGHGIELVLCDSYAPVPAMPAASMQMSGDTPMDAGMDMRNGGTHHDRGTCPYGSSPALAAPLVLSSGSIPLLPNGEPLAASAQVAHYQAPSRSQSARGPPG